MPWNSTIGRNRPTMSTDERGPPSARADPQKRNWSVPSNSTPASQQWARGVQEERRFGRERLAVGELAPSDREVVHADERADQAARRLGTGCHRQPLVQRAALVGLEMTEAHPADLRRIDHAGDRVPYGGEQRLQPRFEEQGLVVANQELAEL
jgi:hypothetical protein